jgi:hypothetical protein
VTFHPTTGYLSSAAWKDTTRHTRENSFIPQILSRPLILVRSKVSCAKPVKANPIQPRDAPGGDVLGEAFELLIDIESTNQTYVVEVAIKQSNGFTGIKNFTFGP